MICPRRGSHVDAGGCVSLRVAKSKRASVGALTQSLACRSAPPLSEGEPMSVLTIADPLPTAHPQLPACPDFDSLWRPDFPSVEMVDQAAALIPRLRESLAGDTLVGEGPRPYIRFGPGVVEIRSKDYARADRTAQRAVDRHALEVESLTAYLQEHGDFPPDPLPSREVTGWSRKSRANMVRTLGLVDFSPMFEDRSRLPAMLTLTYPGDWLTVAPTGAEVKRHLKAFRKRYQRAWGEQLRCVWKLEFQRRGAPHFHLLVVPPHGEVDGLGFRAWVSQAWADIVAHPDLEQYRRHVLAGTGVDYAEGLKAKDPKRVAVYFLKHGQFRAKEYQHEVPEEWQEPGKGPGRFWGYWGLEKVTRIVELDQDVATHAGRTLRRWSAAQQVTREVQRPRVRGGRVISKYPDTQGLAGAYLVASRSAPKYRKTRTRAGRMATNRGFVMVNSGPMFVAQLSRHLSRIIEINQ